MKKKSYNISTKAAFTLAETLLSLIVLSTAIVGIFSGFDTASALYAHSLFESEAAMIAEREMELVKANIISKKIPARAAKINNLFPIKKHWQAYTMVSAPDPDNSLRLISVVKNNKEDFKMESFLFVMPDGGN